MSVIDALETTCIVARQVVDPRVCLWLRVVVGLWLRVVVGLCLRVWLRVVVGLWLRVVVGLWLRVVVGLCLRVWLRVVVDGLQAIRDNIRFGTKHRHYMLVVHLPESCQSE